MDYEKKYIEYIIKESTNTPELKPALTNLLLDKIDFESFVISIQSITWNYNVDTFKQFKKSIDLDNLLN